MVRRKGLTRLLKTSYHNHTRWSDGSADVATMIKAAEAAGLSEVGFSDHLVLHPGGWQYPWAMRPANLEEYVQEVGRLREGAGLAVRLGIEADYFPETIETLAPLLDQYPFDFRIGSVHFANGFPVDQDRRFWEALTEDQREERWQVYWKQVEAMARSGAFDIAAHLDLPKRFGFRSLEAIPAAAEGALDALAETGMAIELNTSGWFLPPAEPYPSPSLLQAAQMRGIPIVVNADAHRPENIVRGFDRAEDYLRAAGYEKVVCFAQRRWKEVTLD